MKLKSIILALGTLAFLGHFHATFAAAVAVTTYHNDNSRVGLNNAETILNTSNVNTGSFGKLFSLPVDGQVYGQPLYVPSVAVPGQGTHNILYVTTMHNSVYAFDADSGSPTPLWRVNFGASVPCSQVSVIVNRCYDVAPEIGILSTPVIDTSRGALYVVAETATSTTQTQFALHALDVATGLEKTNSPKVIAGQVSGTGDASVAGVVVFDPNWHFQRTGLTLLRGNIYFGFASHSDDRPYHGWIFGYDGGTLNQVMLKCLSPNFYGNGVWQGGAAFASDSASNLYIQTGNGSFTASTGGTEWGEALLKLNTVTNAITSYFVPSAENFWDSRDYDMGAGGAILLPGSSLLVAPMVVAGGKEGTVFLLNSANLKGYNTVDNVVQEFQALTYGDPWSGTAAHFGDSVFYNNALYFWGAGNTLKRYAFSGNSFSLSSSSANASPIYTTSAPSMSISSNGLVPGTGILWAADSDGWSNGYAAFTGTLRAYSTADVSTELWDSNQRGSLDYAGNWSKFIPPTIVNGKVYLATLDGKVNVYGLLPH